MRPFTAPFVFASLLLLLTLSGCGSLLGGDEVPTPTPTRELPPTFTPTPRATDTPDLPTPTAVSQVQATPLPATPTSEPSPTTPPEPTATVVEAAPTATVELKPSLVISSDAINVRGGPGTAYAKVGVASLGETFEVIAKNEQGDWWQVCCFDGQPGWLFGDLVDLQHVDAVAVAEAIPAPPEPAATPVPAATAPPASNLVPGQPSVDNSTTAGNLDPSAQYQIVHFHVRGLDDNNGGIFNQGAQHHIFLTVLDENGNGLDGAVVKDAVGDKLNIVTGITDPKGPGKTEIEMDWDPYKLYVSADPSGLVTSQVSNQMNTAHPHIPDIVGRLGPVDNEYAICPTPDDRCTPPFFHAHFSYEITFQKVR